MNTGRRPVTDDEIAELLPLLGTLSKVISKSGHQVPSNLSVLWTKYALAPRHMNVLLSLGFRGAMSVSDLSARLGVGLAMGSLLVGELSRVGLVVRTEDERDRRRTMVDLAPAYRQSIRGFMAQKTGLLRKALEPLDAAERAALVKGLRAILGALEGASAESTAGLPVPVSGSRRRASPV